MKSNTPANQSAAKRQHSVTNENQRLLGVEVTLNTIYVLITHIPKRGAVPIKDTNSIHIMF